jgi:uncharacterized membrane protein YgdD (TMEM256/DUF423 family)
MLPAARRAGAAAAVLLALATVLGALGAHALKDHLAPLRYEMLQTAVRYQFFHSLGLLGVALLLDRLELALLRWAAWLLVGGIVLFSGSLYLLLAGAPAIVGVATPLGGLALIGSWMLVAYALLRGRAAR